MNILDSTLSLLFLFLSVQTRNGNSRLVLSFPVACERSRTRGTSWKTREHGSGPAGVSAGSVPRVTSHRGRLLQLGTRNGRSKRPALLVRGPVRSGAKSRVACVTLALLPRWVERPETFAGARLPLAVSATGTDACTRAPVLWPGRASSQELPAPSGHPHPCPGARPPQRSGRVRSVAGSPGPAASPGSVSGPFRGRGGSSRARPAGCGPLPALVPRGHPSLPFFRHTRVARRESGGWNPGAWSAGLQMGIRAPARPHHSGPSRQSFLSRRREAKGRGTGGGRTWPGLKRRKVKGASGCTEALGHQDP